MAKVLRRKIETTDLIVFATYPLQDLVLEFEGVKWKVASKTIKNKLRPQGISLTWVRHESRKSGDKLCVGAGQECLRTQEFIPALPSQLSGLELPACLSNDNLFKLSFIVSSSGIVLSVSKKTMHHLHVHLAATETYQVWSQVRDLGQLLVPATSDEILDDGSQERLFSPLLSFFKQVGPFATCQTQRRPGL
jgi:hypothetical protein